MQVTALNAQNRGRLSDVAPIFIQLRNNELPFKLTFSLFQERQTISIQWSLQRIQGVQRDSSEFYVINTKIEFEVPCSTRSIFMARLPKGSLLLGRQIGSRMGASSKARLSRAARPYGGATPPKAGHGGLVRSQGYTLRTLNSEFVFPSFFEPLCQASKGISIVKIVPWGSLFFTRIWP